jgi:hypothetical protein
MRLGVRWLRCQSPAPSAPCSPIPGASRRTYRLTSADVGKSIRFRVAAVNRAGATRTWAQRTARVRAALAQGAGEASGTATTTGIGPVANGSGAGSGDQVVRADESWSCRGAVDLDLVKVTIRDVAKHAVYLGEGCTGTIRRLEVDTSRKDGVKIRGARNLVIESGTIICRGRDSDEHQDGVQAQYGDHVTFRNLRVDCRTANNAAFFVSAVRAIPTDVVCDHCLLLPANSTVNIQKSIRSGVRNSIVCRGNARGIRIQPAAIDPVNSGNVVLARLDPRCRGS